MHTFEKIFTLLSAPFLAAALAASAATLPSENIESESDFDDVLSDEERDDFEQFLQERQAEEAENSGGRTLEEAVHGSGSASGSGSWDAGRSSTLGSWSAGSSTGESFGGMEGLGGAATDSGYGDLDLMDSNDLVSGPQYSAPERPGPASSVVEEFSAIGGEIQPKGNGSGASERYGMDSDSFDYSNPFDSPDSEASSGTDLGWISERNSDPDSTRNQQSFGTQIWTSRPDTDEPNAFAPERGERNTRSRGNATPDYLLD